MLDPRQRQAGHFRAIGVLKTLIIILCEVAPEDRQKREMTVEAGRRLIL
jgi:hypothetical protein